MRSAISSAASATSSPLLPCAAAGARFGIGVLVDGEHAVQHRHAEIERDAHEPFAQPSATCS